jgi:hypothetical protein
LDKSSNIDQAGQEKATSTAAWDYQRGEEDQVSDRFSGRILSGDNVHGSTFTLATIEEKGLANVKSVSKFLARRHHWTTWQCCVQDAEGFQMFDLSDGTESIAHAMDRCFCST